MKHATLLLLSVAAVAAIVNPLPTRARAATIVLVNKDGNQEGLNDRSAALPEGGNQATTLGAQRLTALRYAADMWETALDSTVPITVDVSFDSLQSGGSQACSATSALLGLTSPDHVLRDFPGARRPDTWYVQALANRLAGTDLVPDADDVKAAFNSDVDDSTACLFPFRFYYGLDGKAPSGTIDFVTLVLHEFAHGFGFIPRFGLASGKKLSGHDDAYLIHLEDHSRGMTLDELDDSGRQAAVVDTGDLHWVGAEVVAAAGFLTAGRDKASGHVQMYAPSPIEAGSSVSHFSTSLAPNELMEPSFTAANHDIFLTTALLDDVGWNLRRCGDANGDGKVNATDALFVLRAAVGIQSCADPSVCDVDGSGSIKTVDALLVLKHAVGQSATYQCAPA